MPAVPADRIVGCASGGVIAAGRYTMSPFWRDLAPGWHNITPTGTLPNGGIMAFSGMALDTIAGMLYLFGGGHRDYWGNEVWAYNLETRAPWVKHYNSDINYGITVAQAQALVDNVNFPGAIVVGGAPVRPITRHTYYSELWIDSTKRLLAEGSSLYSGGPEQGDMLVLENGGAWPMAALDRWLYNPLDKTWFYDGAESLGMTRLGGYNVYNRVTDRVYSVGSPSAGSSSVWVKRYNPHTKVVETLSTQNLGMALGTSLACVDTKRNRIIVVGYSTTEANATNVWAYDVASNTWAQLSVSGAIPTSVRASCWPNTIYSTATDRVLLMRNNAQGMYTLDLETNIWSVEAIGTTSDHGYTFGGFAYDYRRKVALLVHATSGLTTRIWAHKEA